MSKTGLVAILLLIAGKSYSQENHFILLQADNNQPFYAVLDGKTYPSSSLGHLILPGLRDSAYLLTIGFPKDLFPEQQYAIRIDKEDLSLRLRVSDERSWGLFDPRSQELKVPVKKTSADKPMTPDGEKKDDAFSRLMAGVVNDTAVMYAGSAVGQTQNGGGLVTTGSGQAVLPKAAEEQPSVPDVPAPGGIPRVGVPGPGSMTNTAVGTGSDSEGKVMKTIKDTVGRAAANVIVRDSAIKATGVVIKDSTGTAAAVKKEEPFVDKPSPPAKREEVPLKKEEIPMKKEDIPFRKEEAPFVEKLSEKRTAHQLKMVFVDHDKSGKGDTVQIRIPVDTPVTTGGGASSKGKTQEGPVNLASFRSTGNISGNSPVKRRGQPDSSAAGPLRARAGAAGDVAAGTPAKKPVLVNSDCRDFASDEDIDKLRNRMVTAVSDQARIDLAVKVFKSKCVTTGQVKWLANLFMNDQGRFLFFKAVYPFVTDSEPFKGLVNFLTDPKAIKQFKDMTGQP
ncbi:MAG: DUF4476 domain-containing protein [Puia sp.]|nr:DUF4476 domain-containing protein [Puia sp.]